MGFSRLIKARLGALAQRAVNSIENNKFRIGVIDIDLFGPPYDCTRKVSPPLVLHSNSKIFKQRIIVKKSDIQKNRHFIRGRKRRESLSGRWGYKVIGY